MHAAARAARCAVENTNTKTGGWQRTAGSFDSPFQGQVASHRLLVHAGLRREQAVVVPGLGAAPHAHGAAKQLCCPCSAHLTPASCSLCAACCLAVPQAGWGGGGIWARVYAQHLFGAPGMGGEGVRRARGPHAPSSACKGSQLGESGCIAGGASVSMSLPSVLLLGPSSSRVAGALVCVCVCAGGWCWSP